MRPRWGSSPALMNLQGAWAARCMPSATRSIRRDSRLDYIIRWIEQRGIGTYNVGWVCV